MALWLWCSHLTAQEDINTIQSRGFVSQWLVCGPFPSDVDGGIVTAISENKPPLGTRDFMIPLGGMARVQPKHRLEVRYDGQKSIWQKTRSQDGTLDLSPFFPNDPEGVAFAAFYTQSATNKSAYLELESTLGARVYLNGFLIREFPSAPVELGGRENFLIRLRAGMNLFILELPGVSLAALAEATNSSISHLTATTLGNRMSLPLKTGFEFSLKVHPVKEWAGLAYVPILQSLDSFSGQDPDIKQNMALVLHNPQSRMSAPIQLTTRAKGDAEDTVISIAPIPPEKTTRVHLALSTGRRPAGSPQHVSIQLDSAGKTEQFSTAFNVGIPSPTGNVYVLTHTGEDFSSNQAIQTDNRVSAIRQRLQIQKSRSEYGFLLGDFEDWYPAWLQLPTEQDTLRNLSDQGKVASLTGYTTSDERVAGGELLIRNLLYGHHTQEALLNHWNPVALAWNLPGFASQSPQILARSGVLGLIHNSDYPGLDGLYNHVAPDGTTLLHRKKNPGIQIRSIHDLRGVADRQRRESPALGLTSDIYIDASPNSTPKPFWIADTEPLSGAHPKLHVSGGGGEAYFQTLNTDLKWIRQKLPSTSQRMNTARPGDLMLQPEIKRVLSDIEHRLLSAEKWSTLATAHGVPYPTEALDNAWRQLLYHSHPARLSSPQSPETYADTMANLRDAAIQAIGAGNRAKDGIAEQINTYANAPVNNNPDATALIVYNSLNWTRSEPVYADITLQNGRGLTLIDETGQKIPYYADRRVIRNRLLAQVRLHFVAENVPSMGYKTYYILPTAPLPELEEAKGETRIENTYMSLYFANGHLESITNAETGQKVNTAPWAQVIAYTIGKDGTLADPILTDDITSALDSPADIRVVTTDLLQRATLTQTFLGGTLKQEFTLYRGVDTLYASIHFEGDTSGRAFALRFQGIPKDHSLTTGERFGELFPGNDTVSGSLNSTKSLIQTVSSFRFTSISPAQKIYTEPTNIPLHPAIMVYGSEPVHIEWANDLVTEFTSLGLPAQLLASDPVTLSALWTDRTPFTSETAPFEKGNTLRVLIGNVEENESTQNLLEQISDKLRIEMEQSIEQATPYYFLDKDLIEGREVPTVLLAGPTSSRTESTVQRFSAMLRENTVPLGAQDESKAESNGITILHHGAALVGQDNSALIYLIHQPAPDTTIQSIHFDYALTLHRPKQSSAWNARSAFAYNTPLEARQTDLHLGPLPSSQSFIAATPTGFIVTALKPAMDTLHQLTRQHTPPTGQWILRGYNPTRRPQEITARFSSPIRNVSAASTLEAPDERLESTPNSFRFIAQPWGIHTMRIHPASKPGSRVSPPAESPSHNPTHAAYWEHHAGAAPSSAFAVHLDLQGDLTRDDQTKTLTITNPDPEEALSGTVVLQASPGWHVSPSQINYTLPAGGHEIVPLTVIATTADNSRGGILAQTDARGYTVQAVLTLDEAPLQIQAVQRRDEVRVTVINTGGLPVSATVDITSHPEYWAELNPDYTTEIHPHRRQTLIPAFGQAQVIFRFTGLPPTSPIKIKVSGNGVTVYDKITLEDI